MIALSNPLLVYLITVWCVLGGVVGWSCGKLAQLLKGHVPAVANVILGALGCLAGAFYSGSLDSTRPPDEKMLWMRQLDLLIGDHQTIFATISAILVVFIANLIRITIPTQR